MDDDKSCQTVVKEIFMKTRDERYAEATKGQRVVYWMMMACIFITLFFVLILMILD